MTRPGLIDRLPLELWVLPLAGLITFLQCGPALDAFFISDDFIWLDCAADTAGDIWHIFNRNLGNFFRPTSHLVFYLVYAGFGLWPLAFNALGLGLHVVNAALLVRITAVVTGDRWTALLAGLVFVATPIYAEVLLWISCLNDSVAALCVLTAVLCWLRFVRAPGQARLSYALALLALLAALGAKEAGVVTLPLMLLGHLSLAWQGRARRRAWRWWYAPPALAVVALLAFQLAIQQTNELVLKEHSMFGLVLAPRLAGFLRNLLQMGWPLLLGALLYAAVRRRRTLRRLSRRQVALAAVALLSVLLPAADPADHHRHAALPSLPLPALPQPAAAGPQGDHRDSLDLGLVPVAGRLPRAGAAPPLKGA